MAKIKNTLGYAYYSTSMIFHGIIMGLWVFIGVVPIKLGIVDYRLINFIDKQVYKEARKLSRSMLIAMAYKVKQEDSETLKDALEELRIASDDDVANFIFHANETFKAKR